MSESKANRTRNLRYKRPALASMGWQSIWEELDAIQEACSDIHWFADQDDETLLNALDGNDEDVWEFKLAFASLEAKANQLIDLLDLLEHGSIFVPQDVEGGLEVVIALPQVQEGNEDAKALPNGGNNLRFSLAMTKMCGNSNSPLQVWKPKQTSSPMPCGSNSARITVMTSSGISTTAPWR